MSFSELAHARYSCRAFDPSRPVTDDELAGLLDAVQAAPTAMNRQPFRVWVLRSSEAQEKMRSCTPCHYDAPLLVLFAADPAQSYHRQEDGLDFSQVDTAIAATHYILAAAEAGLDTCWVGRLDVQRINELFPETVGMPLVGLFPTGHALAGKGGPADRHTIRKAQEDYVTEL